MGAVGDLYDAVESFFDVCLSALGEAPDGAPECAYISESPPPWDTCPCLVVYAGGPQVADTLPLQPVLAPGHRSTAFGQVNLVTLTAVILRCAPQIDDNGDLPSPQEHAAAARSSLGDCWAIWNRLRQAKRDGDLFPPREREFFMDPAVALTNQGGCSGWQISVRTELDGFAA